MSSKITQDSSLAGKPNKGKMFITTSETYISVVFFLFKSTLAKKTFIVKKTFLAKRRHFSTGEGSYRVGQDQLLLMGNGKQWTGEDEAWGWNGRLLSSLGPHEKAIPETEQSDQDKRHSPSC